MEGFLFGGPPDPETQKRIEEEHDRLRMSAEAEHQAMYEMLTSLSPEHLATLSKMFFRIFSRGEAELLAANYEGICSAILTTMHGRCPGCGEDHAKEFLEDLPTDTEGET